MQTNTATVWHEFEVPPMYSGDPKLTVRVSVGQHFQMTFPAGRTVEWEVLVDEEWLILSGDDMRTPAHPATHEPRASARALASFLASDADHLYRCNNPGGCGGECRWPRYHGSEARDLMIVADRLAAFSSGL